MDRPFILHVGQTPRVAQAIKDAIKRAGYGLDEPDRPPQLVVTFVSKDTWAWVRHAAEGVRNVTVFEQNFT